jgi:aspartate/methionine/tyrosine aminotransferase
LKGLEDVSLQTLSRPLAARVARITTLPAAQDDEPDIPEAVVQAAADALDRGETHYADRPGIPELRTLLAEQINARYGTAYKPNDVTVTCGATEARFCALHVLATAGATIVCPGSAGVVEPIAALIGAVVVGNAAEAQAGSVLYLTPADDVDAWLNKAESGAWWVIWDIAGAQPPAGKHPAARPALLPRTLHIDAVDDEMAGWRVGWMVGSEKHAELRAFKQAMTICTTNVSQWAALELLRSRS